MVSFIKKDREMACSQCVSTSQEKYISYLRALSHNTGRPEKPVPSTRAGEVQIGNRVQTFNSGIVSYSKQPNRVLNGSAHNTYTVDIVLAQSSYCSMQMDVEGNFTD